MDDFDFLSGMIEEGTPSPEPKNGYFSNPPSYPTTPTKELSLSPLAHRTAVHLLPKSLPEPPKELALPSLPTPAKEDLPVIPSIQLLNDQLPVPTQLSESNATSADLLPNPTMISPPLHSIDVEQTPEVVPGSSSSQPTSADLSDEESHCDPHATAQKVEPASEETPTPPSSHSVAEITAQAPAQEEVNPSIPDVVTQVSKMQSEGDAAEKLPYPIIKTDLVGADHTPAVAKDSSEETTEGASEPELARPSLELHSDPSETMPHPAEIPHRYSQLRNFQLSPNSLPPSIKRSSLNLLTLDLNTLDSFSSRLQFDDVQEEDEEADDSILIPTDDSILIPTDDPILLPTKDSISLPTDDKSHLSATKMATPPASQKPSPESLSESFPQEAPPEAKEHHDTLLVPVAPPSPSPSSSSSQHLLDMDNPELPNSPDLASPVISPIPLSPIILSPKIVDSVAQKEEEQESAFPRSKLAGELPADLPAEIATMIQDSSKVSEPSSNELGIADAELQKPQLFVVTQDLEDIVSDRSPLEAGTELEETPVAPPMEPETVSIAAQVEALHVSPLEDSPQSKSESTFKAIVLSQENTPETSTRSTVYEDPDSLRSSAYEIATDEAPINADTADKKLDTHVAEKLRGDDNVGDVSTPTMSDSHLHEYDDTLDITHRRNALSSDSDASLSLTTPPTSQEPDHTPKYTLQAKATSRQRQSSVTPIKLSGFESFLLFHTATFLSELLPNLSWADFRVLLHLSRTTSMCIHSQKHLVFHEFLENYSEKTHPALDLSFNDVDLYHMTRALAPVDYASITHTAEQTGEHDNDAVKTIRECLHGYNRVVLKCRNAFKAPLLRVFMVTTEKGWHSDDELEQLENQIKGSGGDADVAEGIVTDGYANFMKVGDLIQNVAMNPYTAKRPIVDRSDGATIVGPNDGKLVWDGNFLRDLDFHPTLPWGHLPSWLDALKYPPGYWHPTIASAAPPGSQDTGEAAAPTLMTLDFSPYLQEIQETLRLEKARIDAVTDERSGILVSEEGELDEAGNASPRKLDRRVSVVSTRTSPRMRSPTSPTDGRRVIHLYTYRAQCVVAPWGEYVLEAPGTVEGARDLIARATKPGGCIWRMCRDRTRWGRCVVELWDWPGERKTLGRAASGVIPVAPKPLASPEQQSYDEQRQSMMMMDENFARISHAVPPVPALPAMHRQHMPRQSMHGAMPVKIPAHRPAQAVMPVPLSTQQQQPRQPSPQPRPMSAHARAGTEPLNGRPISVHSRAGTEPPNGRPKSVLSRKEPGRVTHRSVSTPAMPVPMQGPGSGPRPVQSQPLVGRPPVPNTQDVQRRYTMSRDASPGQHAGSRGSSPVGRSPSLYSNHQNGSRTSLHYASPTMESMRSMQSMQSPLVQYGAGPQHGQVPHGQVPHGQVPRGQVPHGQVPHGQVPHGPMPHGQVPHGQVPHGPMPHGPPMPLHGSVPQYGPPMQYGSRPGSSYGPQYGQYGTDGPLVLDARRSRSIADKAIAAVEEGSSVGPGGRVKEKKRLVKRLTRR